VAHVSHLKRQVKAHGGALTGGPAGRWYVYQCEAPAGKVWSAGSTHLLRVEWLKGDTDYRAAAICDALERVALGLADCDDAECEYCCPQGG
jgi:hypothetical protein